MSRAPASIFNPELEDLTENERAWVGFLRLLTNDTDPSPRDDKKRIKDLERDLARKEKALAEAAALIILRKKAEAIWGRAGEDE